MSTELLAAFEQLARERGIAAEVLFEAVEAALADNLNTPQAVAEIHALAESKRGDQPWRKDALEGHACLQCAPANSGGHGSNHPMG